MCAEVCIRGVWCETVGELRAALPDVEIVKDARYNAMPADHHCLCGVDIAETLNRAGLTWRIDENWDYHVEPEAPK